MKLDEALARQAHRRGSSAASLESAPRPQLADGIIRIATARMVSAIKEISIAKGHDPRDFTLLAYGGAGPMHAAFIAEELEIRRVVVPWAPGNFSAFGSLIGDVRRDYVQTRLLATRGAAFTEVADTFATLEREAAAALTAEGDRAGTHLDAPHPRDALRGPGLGAAGPGARRGRAPWTRWTKRFTEATSAATGTGTTARWRS